jgi:hypothetical protein
MAGIPARLLELAKRVPLALWIVLGLGVLLRALLWLEYSPAMMNNPDATAYLKMAVSGLFVDPARPAGYPAFLRVLHEVSTRIEFTIAIQHLLGILTGVLLYATVRRVGAPVWAGVIAAAAVLLSLDQIQFEHSLQAEGPFTFALAFVLYAAVRALEDPRELLAPITSRHLWLAGAAVALGTAAWTRAIGVPLIPFFALWVVLAIPGRIWTRLAHGALVSVLAGGFVLLYFSLNQSQTGHFGLTQSTGWALYARTAPFADCSQFEPPAGTEALCEGTNPRRRNAPDFYAWVPESPAYDVFGEPPNGNEQLNAFAREVIIHQPLYYMWVSFRDFSRYFFPGLNDEQIYIVDYPYLDLDRRQRPVERDVLAAHQSYYTDMEVSIGDDLTALTDLQQVLRVPPFLMFQALLLAVAGIFLGRGRQRAAIALLLGVAVLGLAIPSATVSYNARYATPFAGPLVAAGAIGLWLVIRRLTAARTPTRAAARSGEGAA